MSAPTVAELQAAVDTARSAYARAADHAAYTASRMMRLLADSPERADAAQSDADDAGRIAAASLIAYAAARGALDASLAYTNARDALAAAPAGKGAQP